jgi:hypothetical protein
MTGSGAAVCAEEAQYYPLGRYWSMLRVVTLNLWGDPVQTEARLEAMVDEFAALCPDVMCLREVIFTPGGLTT